MYKYLMRNPRMIVVLVGLIGVAGSVALALLPRMEDPRLVSRAGRITTELPGANALRVETLVTEKLEEELREIEEIKELISVSSTNLSFVAVELHDDVSEAQAENVWARIRDRTEAARDEMPPAAGAPEFQQFEITANALIVGLAWNGVGEPNFALLRRHMNRLKKELDQIPGTEKTETFGDPEEEILVTLDPDRMSAIQLTANDVSETILASDAKVSAGILRGDRDDVLLEVEGELDSLDRIAQIPIQRGGGNSFVKLSDFATIEKAIQSPPESAVFLEDQRALAIGVQVRPSYRIDRWSHRAQQVLERFSSELPETIRLQTVFEQSTYVEKRLTTLFQNLIFGGLAIVVVIFLMMGWRSALIVGSSLPLVCLAVLGMMFILDVPIHQMSISGLIIALGLMIDNAIVVVDEISQRIRRGLHRFAATQQALSFLRMPLLGSTATTALSFAPIILMEGPAGEFVGSIAVVTVVAMLSSFLLAMTVISALAGIGLPSGDSRSWLQNGFSSQWLKTIYRAGIRLSIKAPLVGVLAGLLLPVLGWIVAFDLKEQFFPPADRNQFQVEIELTASGSLQETQSIAARVRQELLEDERIVDVSWFLGESAPIFYYNLVPTRKNASQYAQAIVSCHAGTDIRGLVLEKQVELEKQFPAASVLLRQLEQGPPFDAPVEARLIGPDLKELRVFGEQLRILLTETQHVHHTRAGLAESLPKIKFAIDEQQARLANLNYVSIAQSLNATLEGVTGGSIMDDTEELPIRVRVSGDRRSDLNKITSLNLLGNANRNPRDGSDSNEPVLYSGVPLSAIGNIELDAETASITRLNGRRMNEVQAFIEAGVLPATVLNAFREKMETSKFELPPGYSLVFAGAEAERDEAVDALIGKGFIILSLMIAMLVISLQSFRFAGLLFVVAALAVGLGLGSLWLVGFPWGFMSLVAIMGMIGVAVNDSIVVLSSIRALPDAEQYDVNAITDRIVASTRHVLATTATTTIGFAPLVLYGGEFWQPVAVAISGGVGGATVLALLFVPSCYVLIRRRKTQ